MNLLSNFKPITTFVFDIDGVLTDGSILVFESGEQVRSMSIKDGYAIQLAIRKNYQLIILSGGSGTGVKKRLEKLGVTDIHLELTDKKSTLESILKERQIPWKKVLFMGDDLPDYALMKMAGLPCSPADAAGEIKQAALYISPFGGGKGAVRDVIEKVLQLNNHWIMETGIASR